LFVTILELSRPIRRANAALERTTASTSQDRPCRGRAAMLMLFMDPHSSSFVCF
jgi:hypothetical protein